MGTKRKKKKRKKRWPKARATLSKATKFPTWRYEADAENPKPEIAGWEKRSLNTSWLRPRIGETVALPTRGFTRVRCCRNHWASCAVRASFTTGRGWHGWSGGYHAGPYNEVAQGESNAEQSDDLLGEPQAGGWEKKSLNATSLEPSTSRRQFCIAHHVDYLLGLHTSALPEHLGGWRGYNEAKAIAMLLSCKNQLPFPRRMPVSTLTRPHDEVGPFLAVPEESESQVGTIPFRFKPRHFTRGGSFCQVHQIGYFCDGVIECAAASSDGASSNVSTCPQLWIPRWSSRRCRCGVPGDPCGLGSEFFLPCLDFSAQHGRVHCCNDHDHFV